MRRSAALAIVLAACVAPSTPSTPPLVADEAVGPLVARLSEPGREFIGENLVTNETTVLDVAGALRDRRLRGRAYVGVGPDQNFTYLALLEPAVAYVVDIRRANLLEHFVFRGAFEAGATRAEFLSALLARPLARGDDPIAAYAKTQGDPALLEAGIARTTALLRRLRVHEEPGDADAVRAIHTAFFRDGVDLAYALAGVTRRYPTFGETAGAGFLASEARYVAVRALERENRVIPVVGDFGGAHALAAVAADMRARGLRLGVFYASNVEPYLFDAGTYARFVANVAAMPRDDASLLVRVWFDEGRAHPRQRGGHKTTTLAFALDVFLERARERPYGSYWEVVNDDRAVLP